METLKEEFARVSNKSIDDGATIFVYIVLTPDNAKEVIIVNSALETKVKYINAEYNDNLELSRFTKIKILNYMFV